MVNDKLQPLPTYRIRNRICFRAKPPARRSWRSYPCSGVPTPGSAVICCAKCRWEEGEGDAWEFAQVSSEFKCNSNWSQGSAQCQLACCADGTFWSSSTFIQASRDAVWRRISLPSFFSGFTALPADSHWCKLGVEHALSSRVPASPFLWQEQVWVLTSGCLLDAKPLSFFQCPTYTSFCLACAPTSDIP